MDVGKFVEHYQQLGRFWQRVGRVIPIFILYIIFCMGIGTLLGAPYSPVRGPVSAAWNQWLLWGAVLTFSFSGFLGH